MNIVKEHFNNINEMLNIINNRSNNHVMRDENSSEKCEYSFTRTHNYQEAVELYQNGYSEPLEQIKTGIAQDTKKLIAMTSKRQVRTGVVGYAPHVPNAILGLPNSMILTSSTSVKTKAVAIVYDSTANWSTSASQLIKAGIVVLNVINRLEMQGVRVKLKLSFYNAVSGCEYTHGTVSLKDYREHLDLLKLCFPLVHPSMFRRLGFKWVETVPDLTEYGYSCGYGQQNDDVKFIKKHLLKDNEEFLNLQIIRENSYDADKIIKTFNLK